MEECGNREDDDCDGRTDETCASCKSVKDAVPAAMDGSYLIDVDGDGPSPAMDVYCDMTTNGGGWTLCASLTKGYVPADMLHNADAYAFQARKSMNANYVFEREAPARSTATWDAPQTLNYGQFCRRMGPTQAETTIVAKLYNWSNNFGATARGQNYSLVRQGVYAGNLFLQWFTNSTAPRVFTRRSGDTLYVQSDNSGYGGPYVTPMVGWTSATLRSPPYTMSTNPWNSVNASVNCWGCTTSGAGYVSLPYTNLGPLNNMSDSLWAGIPNPRYGWSDCTANGDCDYHESGLGVWLFYVR
jgi:hypothetical protein